MMQQPFLTIGIPTWNRNKYLTKNVLHLLQTLKNFWRNAYFEKKYAIEILVSDNASTDETENTCKAFAKKYPFFTYYRQQLNLGANKNFETILEKGKGKYIWLLGDDDLISEDALEHVIKDLETFAPSVTIGQSKHDDTKQLAMQIHFHHSKLVDFKIFNQYQIIEIAGKMSSLIFKKNDIKPYLDIAKPIISETNTPWPHLVWLVLLLNEKNNQALIMPYAINQLISSHWHNLIFTGKDLIKILFLEQQILWIALKEKISDKNYCILINRVANKRILILIKCVLYATYLDNYFSMIIDSFKCFKCLRGFNNKFYFFTFLLVPIVLPKFIRKIIFNFIGTIFNHQKIKMTIQRLVISQQIIKKLNQNNQRVLYNAAQL